MLRPSYSELMNVLNGEENLDNKVTSRYTIVIATAKRARQIIDGDEALAENYNDKAVSTAVREMYDGKIHVRFKEEEVEKPITHGNKREQIFATEI